MTDDVRPAGDGPGIRITGSGQGNIAAGGGVINFAGWAQATVIYIGSAMAAGVIGNLAYDALKAALGKLRRREVSPDLRTPDPDIVYLARSVVNARFAELGIDELAGADVDAVCLRTPDGVEVLFRVQPRGVMASVQLSVDEQRADVKAEVRLPERLVSQRGEVKDDGLAVGVLRASDGWESLPPG